MLVWPSTDVCEKKLLSQKYFLRPFSLMREVIVIGAGFSGMTAAYYLNKSGYKVEVFEKQNAPGGLIKTVETPWGECELAANGILNSKLFEDLAHTVGLTLV